jgi:hypothetical protein
VPTGAQAPAEKDLDPAAEILCRRHWKGALVEILLGALQPAPSALHWGQVADAAVSCVIQRLQPSNDLQQADTTVHVTGPEMKCMRHS